MHVLLAQVVRGDGKARSGARWSSEQLGIMTADVMHDMRGSLTVLEMSLSLLRNSLADGVLSPDEVSSALDDAFAAVDHLSEMSSSVQVLGARAQVARRIDVDDEVHRACRLARYHLRDGLALHECLGGAGSVVGFAGELCRLTMNLLLNAFDSQPVNQPGRVSVTTARDDGLVVIRVEDTGCGIAPERLAHIFARRQSTKGPLGAGIGLATVLATAERHGGEVVVDSVVHEGSRFEVRIPVEALAEGDAWTQ